LRVESCRDAVASQESEDVMARAIEILLVEDNPGDVELTTKSLRTVKIRNSLHVVRDGIEAMAFLRQEGPFADAPRPDLVLLDLNLPTMDGREVLAAVKGNESLRSIPVVVLTSSEAETDIARSYNLGANCYVTKPVDLTQFQAIVAAIEDFWFTIVRLPTD
jgi:two-component system, chemotaxis family, response regulator Rcp1